MTLINNLTIIAALGSFLAFTGSALAENNALDPVGLAAPQFGKKLDRLVQGEWWKQDALARLNWNKGEDSVIKTLVVP